jgi:hypothetical protein
LVDNNLEKTGMSENDLHESLRLETNKINPITGRYSLYGNKRQNNFILKEEKDK